MPSQSCVDSRLAGFSNLSRTFDPHDDLEHFAEKTRYSNIQNMPLKKGGDTETFIVTA